MGMQQAPSIGTIASDIDKQHTARVVVIDQTAPTEDSASGAIKRTILNGIERENLLIVYGRHVPVSRLTIHAGLDPEYATRRTYRSIDSAVSIIRDFDPHLILYRPLPESPMLHELACHLAFDEHMPIALWFMDDWPAHLKEHDKVLHDHLVTDIIRLCGMAQSCFAISPQMAAVFRDRYGGPEYHVAHNGIDPRDWASLIKSPRRPGPVVFRYSGNLASNMTQDSILRLAHVISALARDGNPVALEVRTHRHWRHLKDKFSALPGVSFEQISQTQGEYRQWLCDADVGVIGYNFDEITVRYTRFSFANKLPELLAAGLPILAIGPLEIETIRYLKEHDLAILASDPSSETLKTAVKHLATNTALRETLAVRAAHHAQEFFAINRTRAKMWHVINSAATTRAKGKSDAVDLMTKARPGFWGRVTETLYADFISILFRLNNFLFKPK
ncbi:hypothetical protein [Aestuariicoccus sp. MJ-SS9]|uniref:hypothetical protein n=1 Tax=Aestuariicoccus sp. MJ-SS9 TaxID=3079855 RepID=UPI00291312C8|nr:hypothetical protein [Aestuariicoccus sp. MJ-SS9]MDU8913288.1 hypothetical protein [Aestuariicoccus sp. MJ-SS9]